MQRVYLFSMPRGNRHYPQQGAVFKEIFPERMQLIY
ncbi:hypothetical protein KL86DPRO_30111 [uncultured delta proteobacterium]|uniref:Uncharacterized protein n=1 Tax=uncultured delta proteobacterium TaxID=34034 RepID=A0A212K7S7_9DELT|nr:hypothetical protein KL86DPRO_30111 [uncultured delta proteobacterium]